MGVFQYGHFPHYNWTLNNFSNIEKYNWQCLPAWFQFLDKVFKYRFFFPCSLRLFFLATSFQINSNVWKLLRLTEVNFFFSRYFAELQDNICQPERRGCHQLQRHRDKLFENMVFSRLGCSAPIWFSGSISIESKPEFGKQNIYFSIFSTTVNSQHKYLI